MTHKQPPEEKTEANLKSLYTRSVVNSLSSGMVNPFMGAYAVKLGASPSLMGWFRSSSNISNNVMQVIWGRLSDRLRKRIPFIILGGLTATLAAGILMMTIDGTLQGMFFVPLTTATVLGAVSSLAVLGIKEKKDGGKPNLRQHFDSDIFSVLKYARRNHDFLKYCYVAAAFEFFMSMSWPLFSITQITILNASMLELALLSVVQSIVMIA
jgi:MFS family permease